jgi:hypothetical protein
MLRFTASPDELVDQWVVSAPQRGHTFALLVVRAIPNLPTKRENHA